MPPVQPEPRPSRVCALPKNTLFKIFGCRATDPPPINKSALGAATAQAAVIEQDVPFDHHIVCGVALRAIRENAVTELPEDDIVDQTSRAGAIVGVDAVAVGGLVGTLPAVVVNQQPYTSVSSDSEPISIRA